MEKFKKSSKKYLAMAITASVAAIFVPPVLAEENFIDVAKDAFYESAVIALVTKEVIGGYPDGTFKPEKLVTRAEAAKMIAFDLQLNFIDHQQTSPTFKDVQKDDWYYQPVTALTNAGIIDGYQDGTFKPNQAITRAELAFLLVRAYSLLHGNNSTQNPFQDVQPNDWFAHAVQVLYDNKITAGKEANYFGAYDPVTRGEIAAFIYKVNCNPTNF